MSRFDLWPSAETEHVAGRTNEHQGEPREVEDLGDGPRRTVVRGRPEPAECRLVRERRHRAEERHGQRVLELPAGGQDLAPDRFDRRCGQRPAVRRAQPADDLRLTLGDIRRHPLTSFEVSDLEGGLCALVEEEEDLVVEVIDPGAPIAQVHTNSRRNFARE